jgi:hypothetical protein
MKTKLFLLGLLILSTGCTTITPVGPMAKVFGSASAAPKKVAPGVSVSEPIDSAGGPIVQQAPPPPIPTFLVSPGEVTDANTADIVKRVIQEMDADKQALDQFPKYSEISHVTK